MSYGRAKDLRPGDKVKVRYPGEYIEVEAHIHSIRDEGKTVDLIGHPYGDEIWSVTARMVTLVISPDAPMLGGQKRDSGEGEITGREPSLSQNR